VAPKPSTPQQAKRGGLARWRGTEQQEGSPLKGAAAAAQQRNAFTTRCVRLQAKSMNVRPEYMVKGSVINGHRGTLRTASFMATRFHTGRLQCRTQRAEQFPVGKLLNIPTAGVKKTAASGGTQHISVAKPDSLLWGENAWMLALTSLTWRMRRAGISIGI